MNHKRFSFFTDKKHEPEAGEVAEVLAGARGAWEALRERLQAAVGPLEEHWHYGGVFYGWSLRLRKKKRPVVYLCPREGDFLMSLAVNEATRGKALMMAFPQTMVEILEGAPKYVEGYAVRFEVSEDRQVEDLVRFVLMKLGDGNHRASAKRPT